MRLDEQGARRLVRLVGVAGTAVGVGSIVIPRSGLRAVGLEADGRGVGFMARLFGCRDVALCAALARAAGRPRPDPLLLDAIAASQFGDTLLTLWLWRRGELSTRALLVVLLTAPPTLVAAVAARRALDRAGVSARR